jgi:hypothetical protein
MDLIRSLFRRHKLAILLALLLTLNAVRFWRAKHSSEATRGVGRPFGPPGAPGSADGPPGDPGSGNPFPEPDPAMRQRMEAALQKMPEEQRKAFQDRIKADRAFFESLRDLPEGERRKKMQEYFAQNPPPEGFGPGSPGAGGPGELENGQPIQLPPPDVRRSMDQQIANSQKKTGGS